MKARKLAAMVAGMLGALSAPALAEPWADVGDAQTRSDVEIAAAYGLLDNVTMQWPLSWASILGPLQDKSRMTGLPDDVREAAQRLLDQGTADCDLRQAHASLRVDVTNAPATVRGYDALGRSTVQGQLGYEYLWEHTALHLQVGGQRGDRGDKQVLSLDGSYIAAKFDGVAVYAGYRPHWWGPGWISSLSLSTNARPMPQIGFSRVQSTPSQSWLLSWMGPWQLEGFVGVLDGPRIADNTVYAALRFGFSPIRGLEIGLSRTTQMCGKGHKCSPLVDYFTFSNDDQHVNKTNEQGSIDVRYTNTVLSRPFAVYAQFMNEDTNPIVHAASSRLFGGSVWVPVDGLAARLTFEYANTIANKDIWGGGTLHGSAYNNGQYPDGMRYRGRALGFSLDSDSILYSLQASVVDQGRNSYTLTYHRAVVSQPLNLSGNAVTAAPVRFNVVEARAGLPLQLGMYKAKVDAVVRWQDDQPRPDHGAEAAFELALRFGI